MSETHLEKVHLGIRSYLCRIFAHGVFGADVAVGACLSPCHQTESSCEDQTQHLASGTGKIRRVTKFQKIYEPALSTSCQKGD